MSPALVVPYIAPYVTVIVVAAAIVALAVIIGLIYPAVWSRKSPRRRSALDVIRVLLRR